LRAYDQDMSYVRNAKIDSATGTESTTEFSYSSAGDIDLVHYKRIRSGIGFKYLKKPFKVSAEYMQGSGMIFLGPHKESFDMNVPDGNGNGLTGKANGWYLDGGWRVLDTKFEANLRLDSYNRLVGDALEVNFFTVTVGGQYYLNKKSRLTVNYAHRKGSSANNNSALESNLKGIGGRFAIQMIAVY